jgi:hypothetical protein
MTELLQAMMGSTLRRQLEDAPWRLVLAGLMMTASPAVAQVVPPVGAALIAGPAAAKVGETKEYSIDWGTNWPHICQWIVSGPAQIVGPADKCSRVSVQFLQVGTPLVDQVGWAQSGTTAGGTVYWPDVSVKQIRVTVPPPPPPRPGELVPLSRTTGPYEIRSALMRDRVVVGPVRTVTATESQILNNTGGVTASEPSNRNYVCSFIVDRPTRAFPVSGGSNRIRKCKRV